MADLKEQLAERNIQMEEQQAVLNKREEELQQTLNKSVPPRPELELELQLLS